MKNYYQKNSLGKTAGEIGIYETVNGFNFNGVTTTVHSPPGCYMQAYVWGKST